MQAHSGVSAAQTAVMRPLQTAKICQPVSCSCMCWHCRATPPSSTVRLRARTIKEQEAQALQQDQSAFSESAKWFQSAVSGSKASPAAAAKKDVQAENLVIYTYSNSDLEYERNLVFFVQHAMWEGDGCDYLIIVQQVSCSMIH